MKTRSLLPVCVYCDSPATTYHSIMGDGALCRDCARRDILGWLADCEPGEITKLRRRAEDCLRKNPRQLKDTLVDLIIAGAIDYDDCI